MDLARVDYNQIAPNYDSRYSVDRLQGIEDALTGLVKGRGPKRILEAGCGTGRWLESLAPYSEYLCGIDSSLGMLQKARAKQGSSRLAAAHANALPFRGGSFDFIFCVNAIHHFDNPQMFVLKARELLTPDGALAIAGIDPRLVHRWYLYDYFQGVYERDLQRYPSVGKIVNWMAAAGFERIDYRTVHTVKRRIAGRDILSHSSLKKDSGSQLALLSDAAYAEGVRKIEQAVASAERAGNPITFEVELSFPMITGFLSDSDAHATA